MSTATSSFNVRYPSTSTTGQYRLLELPPELAKVVEDKDALALEKITIRGTTNDDAVLCTDTRTYSFRSVQLSNSYLILTGSKDDDNLVVRDQVNEIIELVPVVPKLDRLTSLLREDAYMVDEEEDDEDQDMDPEGPKKRRRFTYDQMRGLVQASDAELDGGLREKHVLNINGRLRTLPPSQLTQILTYILTILVSHHASSTTVPRMELTDQLQDDHAIPPDVANQICGWFGEVTYGDEDNRKVKGGLWKMDVDAVVKEVGLGILVAHRHDPMTEDALVSEWKAQVGDAFESHVSMTLLAGNCVPITSSGATINYKYFPASDLPTNPSQRFADLFLTRKSWRLEELAPFLRDVAVDKKERDKLLMKFTRTSTGPDGVVWYNARAKY